jgi:NADH-quinone oxidoreductase subunit E
MENFKEIDDIIALHGNDKSSIISILHDVQHKFNYIPEDVLEYVSEKLSISPTKAFGIATFYENFSLQPKGKYIIKICDGTACHVRKSTPIIEALRKELNLSEEKITTDDLMFTVETVSCLGACGLVPVITINDKVYGKMTPEAVVDLLNEHRKEIGNEDK